MRDALETVDGADITVILTEWKEFRALDLKAVNARMRKNMLVDLRNIYLSAQAKAASFSYAGVGR